MTFHVLRQLFNTAELYPQKVAIVLDDQIWTYSELVEQIERTTCHLHNLNIVQGQVVYQFVERSLEMICGLFGIMCAGGVYCPLNPTDPSERLVAILEQLQGQYVLMHGKTRNKFPSTTAIRQFILLEEILSPSSTVENMDDLLDCRGCGVAVIVCTSGTTGRHKAVVHTFKSISACYSGLYSVGSWFIYYSRSSSSSCCMFMDFTCIGNNGATSCWWYTCTSTTRWSFGYGLFFSNFNTAASDNSDNWSCYNSSSH